MAEIGFLLSTLGATYFNLRIFDRRSFASLGFERRRLWFLDIITGTALGCLLMSLIFLVELGARWLTVERFAWQGYNASSTDAYGVLLLALVFFIMVGFTEELTMRGYVLQNLRDEWGTPVAVVLSSAIFGLLHAANPNVTPMALFSLIMAGVLFAVGYLVTNGLWLPIALHFSWNFFEGPVFGFPVSGTTNPFSLVATRAVGPELMTGGPFGPEAGLTGLGAVIIGIGLLLAWGQKRKSLLVLPFRIPH